MEDSYFPPIPISGLDIQASDPRLFNAERLQAIQQQNGLRWPSWHAENFYDLQAAQGQQLADHLGSVESGSSGNANKRTRTTRSCDQCRRKKVKCGGGGPCDVCRVFGLTCSYNDPTRKRGPTPKTGRTERHRRLRQMDTMADAASADLQVENPASGSHVKDEDDSPDNALSISPEPSSDEPGADDLDNLGGSIVVDERNQERYFGEGSFLGLLKAIDAKKQGSRKVSVRSGEPNLFASSDISSVSMRRTPSTPYEAAADRMSSQLPPTDLLANLVSLYFFRIAVIFPVLHRPSFERSLGEFLANPRPQENQKSSSQADVSPMYSNALALSVCALGSLGTTDERAKRDPLDPTSVGTTFADRAMTLRMTGLYRAGVHSVQALANLAMFRFAQGETAAGYILVGDAVRLSQNLGIHRTIRMGRFSRVEGEVRKRTWIMVYLLDRYTAVLLGRPTLIRDCDCDVELPSEIDDEYLNDADIYEPKQPDGEPAVIMAYNFLYRGACIMGRIVNLLYAAKPEDMYGSPIEPDLENIATILDKQTEEWHDTMPGHLREAVKVSDKNTTGRDVLWAVQASRVEIEYQAIKLLIHRAFISKESVRPDGRIGAHFFEAVKAALQLANHINEMQRRGFGFFILITHMHFGLEASIFLCIALGQLCKASQTNSQQLIAQIQAVLSEQLEVYSGLTTYRFSIQAVDLIVDALRVCDVTVGRPLTDVKVANIPWYSVHTREDAASTDEKSSTTSPPISASRRTGRVIKTVSAPQVSQSAQDAKPGKLEAAPAEKHSFGPLTVKTQASSNNSNPHSSTMLTSAQLRSLGLGNLGQGGGLSPMLNTVNMNQYFQPSTATTGSQLRQSTTSNVSDRSGNTSDHTTQMRQDEPRKVAAPSETLAPQAFQVQNHFTFPENYTFDAMQADLSHGSALYPSALSQIFPVSPLPGDGLSGFGLEEWLGAFNGSLGAVPT